MDPGLLMSVLVQGEEQARQLKAQLDDPLDVESCKSLARQVQLSFANAVVMAKSLETGGTGTGTGNVAVVGGSDSPLQSGGSESPRSEGSDQGMKGEMVMLKKRKGLPKWSSQVRVNLGGGIEGPLDDGYSWRKYGQKDILGAKYPRGYYRCTHRNSQGCLATKQVQRSDGDPSVFDVSYRGKHTCIEKPQKGQASPKRVQYNSSDSNQQQQQLLDSLRASLTVKTEGLEANSGQVNTANSSSFSFPSTPASCMQPQSNMFLSPSVHDNNPFSSSAFSPNFMSGSASESNYLSSYGAGPNIQNSASELIDIVSAATSAGNSPMVDIDFALGHGEFDPNFAFDSPSFF